MCQSERANFKTNFDKLVEHCYELTEADFEPETAPQMMAEYLNKQMLSLIKTANQTMIKYEEFVKEAEAHLSKIEVPQTKPPAQQPPPSLASQPAPKPTMSIFRTN